MQSADHGSRRRRDVQPTSLGFQQAFRAGIGGNATVRDQPSVLLGVAIVGGGAEYNGVFADGSAPLGPRFSLTASGHTASGNYHRIYGLAVGGRYLLRGPAPWRQ